MSDKTINLLGARVHNLKNIDVNIPLGTFTCVTGVSGSGKSSLVNEILYKTLARDLNRAKSFPGDSDGVEGLEALDKVIDIDQSPIGRTLIGNKKGDEVTVETPGGELKFRILDVQRAK